MDNCLKKPKLVYFQWRHLGIPEFLQAHANLHVKCLSEFFEVVVISTDCDYKHVCEKYSPDLTLFESGYRSTISQRIRIKNTSAFPQIPKLGLHNGDSWCDCRVGFLSDMEEWGIETFFTICTTMAEHTPEIAENLFVWPNFIDSDIYHDYGKSKNVPIMFNGHMNSLYPWRQEVYNVVSKRFPCLTYPHLGYENHSSLMIHGKQYAEAMNASWFVPTCGTLAKEVVRKHFEIPGSMSCLITEESNSLFAAGFRDMENCVFATSRNITEKLNYLFEDRDKLKSITQAGYNLVQSLHTLKQRSQIYQWFMLNKEIAGNQKIIQSNPFGPLEIKISLAPTTEYIKGNGLDMQLLQEADKKLREGKYEEAERLYLRCLNYIYWMPEPKLKLAICHLMQGKSDTAYDWLIEPIQNNLGKYKASNPDPVEWAYLIICFLCKGDLVSSAIRASQFPSLKHPELNRARWLVSHLQSSDANVNFQDLAQKASRSVHRVEHSDFRNWANRVQSMLKACGQVEFANRLNQMDVSQQQLANVLSLSELNKHQSTYRRSILLAQVKLIEQTNIIFRKLRIPDRKTGLPSASFFQFVVRLGKWWKLNQVLTLMVKSYSHLKSKGNHVHAVSLVDDRADEYYHLVQTLLTLKTVKTILFIGVLKDELLAKALFSDAVLVNADKLLFLLDDSCKLSNDMKVQYAGLKNVAFHELSEFENLTAFKAKHRIDFFDLVIVGNSKYTNSILVDELEGANCIIINNINEFENFILKEKLLRTYRVVSQRPMQECEYTFLER
jgi:hypothetical protein